MNKITPDEQHCVVKPPFKRRHVNLTAKVTSATLIDQSPIITNLSSSSSLLLASEQNNKNTADFEKKQQEKVLAAQLQEALMDAAYIIWRDEVVTRKRKAAERNCSQVTIK